MMMHKRGLTLAVIGMMTGSINTLKAQPVAPLSPQAFQQQLHDVTQQTDNRLQKQYDAAIASSPPLRPAPLNSPLDNSAKNPFPVAVIPPQPPAAPLPPPPPLPPVNTVTVAPPTSVLAPSVRQNSNSSASSNNSDAQNQPAYTGFQSNPPTTPSGGHTSGSSWRIKY